MKEIPILFSTPMVQAIMEGRKTQTRRIVTSRTGYFQVGKDKATGKVMCVWATNDDEEWQYDISCPYGNPGDILWVRESWSPKYVKGCLEEFKAMYPGDHPWIYKADDSTAKRGYAAHAWKPSIHMLKDAARIWLEVTSVRVERLKDISEEDAKAEGVRFTDFGKDQYGQQNRGYHVLEVTVTDHCLLTARSAFGNLWGKINGIESWDTNPWVWVIEFKVLSTTGKP